MHWTLDDINELTPDQLNLLTESLRSQKELEAKAAKGKKSRRRPRRRH